MRNKADPYKPLAASFLMTVLILLCSLHFFEEMAPAQSIRRLGLPLIRLMGFVSLGLFIGQSLELLGWTRQFSVLARPVFKFSNIGHRCAAVFTTAFISGASANAMLFDYYENRQISKLELFLSNYLNHFPAFFLHLPTTMFIVLPLTGKAGAMYFLLTFLATLLRTVTCLFLGRILLPPIAEKDHELNETEPQKTDFPPRWRTVFHKIRQTLPRRVLRILVWVMPIYTIVFVLSGTGCFQAMNMALSRHIGFHIIPVESLSVVLLSFAAEFTSGFAAAGALMTAGILSVKQTVIALLLGNILAFPIRALRHQLPRYMGIFAPKLGLQLLMSGQFFRVTSLIIVGTIYYLVA